MADPDIGQITGEGNADLGGKESGKMPLGKAGGAGSIGQSEFLRIMLLDIKGRIQDGVGKLAAKPRQCRFSVTFV